MLVKLNFNLNWFFWLVDFKLWFRSCDEHTRRPLSGRLVHVGEPAWVSRSLEILLVSFVE
jgi:hypothetical protein